MLKGLAIAAVLLATPLAWPASYYTQRLADPKAVYFTGSSAGDDTAALQHAIDQVQETTGQGIVLLPAGRYRVSGTLYVWPATAPRGPSLSWPPTHPDSRTLPTKRC